MRLRMSLQDKLFEIKQILQELSLFLRIGNVNILFYIIYSIEKYYFDNVDAVL